MRQTRTRVLFGIVLGALFVLPIFVLAQGVPPPSEIRTGEEIAAVPGQAGIFLPTTDPRVIAAKIIQVALGFLGIVAVSLMVWGGYLWMTSVGNEEQIGKAKKVLINATIGLIIMLSAFAIVQFVLRALSSGVAAPPLPPPAAAAARVGGGALGSGIVESHYPRRGQRNVARNARILITFKDAVDPASITETSARDGEGRPQYFELVDLDRDGVAEERQSVEGLTLRTEAIQIIKTADIEESVRESKEDDYLGSEDSNTEVLVSFTGDLRTLVLTPVSRADHLQRVYLGSAQEPVSYTVYLCGTSRDRANCSRDGIKLAAGIPAFSGRFQDYQWSFEVGTALDLTPPKILSVIPFPDNAPDGSGCGAQPCRKDVPRNTLVQVNFSEPVLPTVASGIVTVDAAGQIPAGTYQALRVAQLQDRPASSKFIAGKFELSNQYQTTEFISRDRCAVNSCGGEVFCLPAGRKIRVEALAATLAEGGGPASAGLFDGLEDVAGNSLDGNGDGRAQGPGTLEDATFADRNNPQRAGGDNARFAFYTSDEILLGAPEIMATSPATTRGAMTPGVALDTTLGITFNRAMAASTLSSRTLQFGGIEKTTGKFWDSWWTVASQNLESAEEYPYGRTRAEVVNGGLWEETDYTAEVRSSVKDLFQNCYFPAGECAGQLTAATPYCCNGQACAAGEESCRKCGF